MQVIGICRFSYPALGGFQVEHDSQAARAAYLYDPARMEDRFRTFEGFTLPALRAQTDPDFTLVIVVGSEGDGLSRLVSESCDRLMSIPMAGVLESLNAGVAASVALYAVAEARAQR